LADEGLDKAALTQALIYPSQWLNVDEVGVWGGGRILEQELH